MPNDTIRIKRYPNRRFYASHAKKYVSLTEIGEMIRDGANVEIVDSATGEDITRVVLIQMIAEQCPERIALFPSAMLHSILRANDLMVSFLGDYFRNSLAYLDYFQQHGASAPLAEPMHWMKAWVEGWSHLPGFQPPCEQPESTPAAAHDDELARRIVELERRIVELEQQQNVAT